MLVTTFIILQGVKNDMLKNSPFSQLQLHVVQRGEVGVTQVMRFIGVVCEVVQVGSVG